MPVGIPLLQALVEHLPIYPAVAFIGGFTSGAYLIAAASEQPTVAKIITASCASISAGLVGAGSLMVAYYRIKTKYIEAQVKIDEIRAQADERAREWDFKVSQAEFDRKVVFQEAELKRKTDYDLAELKRRTDQHRFADNLQEAYSKIDIQEAELANAHTLITELQAKMLDLSGSLKEARTAADAQGKRSDAQQRQTDDMSERVDENHKTIQGMTESGHYPSISLTVSTSSNGPKDHGHGDGHGGDAFESGDKESPDG